MKIFSTNGDMSGKAHQQQQKIFFKESFFRFFMLALLKSLHRHKNGKMAKALTPYVCMMIFLSTPVKRNVCKSHFYATQTSLSLSLTYTQFSIHDGGRKSLFFGEIPAASRNGSAYESFLSQQRNYIELE